MTWVETMDERSPHLDELAESPASDVESNPERVHRKGAPPTVLFVLAVAVLAGIGWSLVSAGDSAETEESAESNPDRADGERAAALASIPASLIAAERFAVDPSGSTARELLTSIGGLEAMTIGEAEGAFDLVSFDPLDPNRLLASIRSSYGEAENQATNELWTLNPDGLTQDLWAPETSHDFAHFNLDGSITMWVRAPAPPDFAPRNAVVLAEGIDGTILRSQPIYASRFVVSEQKVFALTGTGDYYAQDGRFVDLVVDDGSAQTLLNSGSSYGWLDIPQPGLLVAYPRDPAGETAVWDTLNLQRLPDHPLSGRSFQRLAVSGDGSTAVAVTTDGHLQRIELASGATIDDFASVDSGGIIPAITLSHDGSVAITVERSGLVSLWWVGDEEPLATIAGDAGQPRWLAERFAARASSAVATDGGRIAVRNAALPGLTMTWSVIETNIEHWIRQACALAGRSLTADERNLLEFPTQGEACG